MLSILAALALQAPSGDNSWIETRFHRVHLANGNFIDGQLVEESKRLVVLKMKAGTFGIRRDMIDRVEYVRMRSLKESPAPSVAIKAPAASKMPAAANAPERPSTEPIAATPAAAAPFAPAVMQPVDELLTKWSAFAPGSRPETLLLQIPDLGPEAVAYACWRVAHRVPMTPVKELVEALGHQEHPAVLPMLKAVAENGSMDERAALVTPLESLKTPEAVGLLYALIGDGSATVWQPATEAVVRLAKAGSPQEATERIIELMAKAPEKSSYAIALGRIGEADGRRALLEMARDDDESNIRAALQGLAVYADPEDGEIGRRLLVAPSDSLKKAACAFLGQIKSEAAVPDLIDLLSHADSAVVRDAHWALQKITGQRFGVDVSLWTRWLESNTKKSEQK